MKIKVFILTMILTISFSVPCRAIGYDRQLGGRVVNVIECAKSIDIFAHMSIGGELANEIFPGSEDTYGEAFIKGVKKVWQGKYRGKPVYVHIYTLPEAYPYRHIKVTIDKFTDESDYARTAKDSDKVWMYSGDGRNNYTYSYDDFLYVSGHEFAHVLGLFDAYNDKNEYISKFLHTPAGAWNCFRAQDVDYYLLLKYRTWEQYGYYYYSNDSAVVDWLMKRLTV